MRKTTFLLLLLVFSLSIIPQNVFASNNLAGVNYPASGSWQTNHNFAISYWIYIDPNGIPRQPGSWTCFAYLYVYNPNNGQYVRAKNLFLYNNPGSPFNCNAGGGNTTFSANASDPNGCYNEGGNACYIDMGVASDSGGIEDLNQRFWNIDYNSPSIRIYGTTSFSVACSDGRGSGCNANTLQYKIWNNGNVEKDWTYGISGDASYCPSGTECRKYIEASGYDNVNQYGSASTSIFLVDRKPPTDSNIDGATSVSQTSIQVHASTSTDSSSNPVKYSFSGPCNGQATTSQYYTCNSLSPNTPYQFCVTPFDTAGNSGNGGCATYFTSASSPSISKLKILNCGVEVDLNLNNPVGTQFKINYNDGGVNSGSTDWIISTVANPSVCLNIDLSRPNIPYNFYAQVYEDGTGNTPQSGISKIYSLAKPPISLKVSANTSLIPGPDSSPLSVIGNTLAYVSCSQNPIYADNNGTVHYNLGLKSTNGYIDCTNGSIPSGIKFNPVSTGCIPSNATPTPNGLLIKFTNYTFNYPGDTNPSKQGCESSLYDVPTPSTCFNYISNPDGSIYYNVGTHVFYHGQDYGSCVSNSTPKQFPITTPCVPSSNFTWDQDQLSDKFYSYTFKSTNPTDYSTNYCYDVVNFFQNPQSITEVTYNSFKDRVQPNDYIETGGIGTISITSPFGKQAVISMSSYCPKRRFYFNTSSLGIVSSFGISSLDPQISGTSVPGTDICHGCSSLIGTPASGTWTIKMDGQFFDMDGNNEYSIGSCSDYRGVILHIAGKEIHYDIASDPRLNTIYYPAMNNPQIWNWHLTSGTFQDNPRIKYENGLVFGAYGSSSTQTDTEIEPQEDPGNAQYYGIGSGIASNPSVSTLKSLYYQFIYPIICTYDSTGQCRNLRP